MPYSKDVFKMPTTTTWRCFFPPHSKFAVISILTHTDRQTDTVEQKQQAASQLHRHAGMHYSGRECNRGVLSQQLPGRRAEIPL